MTRPPTDHGSRVFVSRHSCFQTVSTSGCAVRILVAVFAAVLLLALSGCTDRFREHQRLQTPTLRPPVEGYARLVLLREARVMQSAKQPWEWRRYRFNLGVCYSGTIAQFSRNIWRETISSACDALDKTQSLHADHCAEEGRCRIPQDAKDAIQRVIDDLEAAKEEFSTVEPADESIPSTEM